MVGLRDLLIKYKVVINGANSMPLGYVHDIVSLFNNRDLQTEG
jgi:hypothetical protein